MAGERGQIPGVLRKTAVGLTLISGALAVLVFGAAGVALIAQAWGGSPNPTPPRFLPSKATEIAYSSWVLGAVGCGASLLNLWGLSDFFRFKRIGRAALFLAFSTAAFIVVGLAFNPLR